MSKYKLLFSITLVISILTTPRVAFGVRPFITDDARITGNHVFQMENWLQINRLGFQNWSVFSTSFDKLEVSVGLVYGKQQQDPIVESPLLQLKVLGLETKPGILLPGMAASIGVFPKKDSTEVFEYLAFTESLDRKDKYLVHQNLGIASSFSKVGNQNKIIWGVGSQIYIYNNFYFINEIFSGDPYVGNSSSAFQLGGRYFINTLIQVDASAGRAMNADSYVWATLGCRIASSKIY